MIAAMRERGRNSTTDGGSLAALAIDGVLKAERESQEAVAACEQAGLKVLELARERARGIIERARLRSVALHGRAAKKVELRATALMEQRMTVAAEAVKQLSDPGRFRLALERVAVQLTTEVVSTDVA
jgi:hypothetical protein